MGSQSTPVSPSRGLAHMSGNDSRGEETGMGKSKTHFRAKVLSQTTVLEGRTFRAFKCPPPPLLRVGQLLPEWHRLVSDQGRIPPETVSFTGWSSANSNLRLSKILAVPLGSGLVDCRGTGVPGRGEATGRCLLRIQRFFVGYFSQKEPGPQGPDSSSA